MEDISPVTENARLPVEIDLRPYLLDHRFDGDPVLPAVEAMHLLADTTKKYLPRIDPLRISGAAFLKFLYLAQISDSTVTGIFNDVDIDEHGLVTARLLTKNRFKKAAFTRLKEHVTLTFGAPAIDRQPVPDLETAMTLQGRRFDVPAERLYRELVPFGPAYQNVQNALTLAEDGAVAAIFNSGAGAPFEPIGSPFPMDAAFHAACAWGQRFSSIIGFPVAFDERIILKPTQPDVTYISRIIPVRQRTDPVVLIFDVYLFDETGVLHESLHGLQLKDVSGGRLKPPQWFQK